MDYHAPTDCQIIKKWLTKCADDSETANYIKRQLPKDCPNVHHFCIEKNGGPESLMQCSQLQYDFGWIVSRYKDNPNIANESVHVQAREALKKYLHYYERWENHSKSLQLEQQTLDRLRTRINDKVMKGRGTWIDWQYLFNAASLLAKCRYTLQYTYPYAYFMESGSRKDLFEYQQAQLEAEIENLSWKIERAETTDLGDLENQNYWTYWLEKRRTTLLKDFFPVEG
ncbi:hypothetical protein DOY81_015077 [Sarcophaga bullata]|nr:hypothetical protein DOY81_015077 [Sarcophaga bullata]